jgi:O-methyltransferase
VLLKRMIKTFLCQVGIEMKRVPRKPNPIRLWDDDPAFNVVYDQMRDHTLVDRTRCFMLYQFALQALYLDGDAAEIGVFRGGTAKLLAKVLSGSRKTFHLFDTFSGMPSTDPSKDIHREGDFAETSLEGVMAYLSDCWNVKFYPGFFPDSANEVREGKFCFVHIDVDIFKSVLDCCSFFYPRMSSGGLMVFDDYGFLSCPGAKEAVDEFFRDKPERAYYLPTGQCLVVRL